MGVRFSNNINALCVVLGLLENPFSIMSAAAADEPRRQDGGWREGGGGGRGGGGGGGRGEGRQGSSERSR